jgi:hypothetical protein
MPPRNPRPNRRPSLSPKHPRLPMRRTASRRSRHLNPLRQICRKRSTEGSKSLNPPIGSLRVAPLHSPLARRP